MGAIRTYRKPKVCDVCGNPLTSKQKAYCCDECRKKARITMQRNNRQFAKELGVPYEKYLNVHFFDHFF